MRLPASMYLISISATLAILNPFLYPHMTGGKTAVILDSFTLAAYDKGGFYDYYCNHAGRTSGFCSIHTVKCDTSCLTRPLDESLQISTVERTLLALKDDIPNLEYLTDGQVSNHPEILASFDRVILLHNEYVSLTEYTAITNHPNVVYLFPNALYAQVVYDKTDNKITLVKGHGYPTADIQNGFGWKYENTEEELNRSCEGWQFRHVSNGIQLNCWLETTDNDTFNAILKALKLSQTE